MAEELASLFKKINDKKLVATGSSASVTCQVGDIIVFARFLASTQTDRINGGTLILDKKADNGYNNGNYIAYAHLTIVEATSTNVSVITVQSNFNAYAIYR